MQLTGSRYVRREPLPGTPEQEALTRNPPTPGLYEEFVLTGPLEGQTTTINGRDFVDGICEVPAHEADGVEKWACKYYGAVRRQLVQSRVLVFGPEEEEWRHFATREIEQRYGSEVAVIWAHPTSYTEPNPEDAGKIRAVVVVQGCEYIGEAYSGLGIAETLALPGLPHMPAHEPDAQQGVSGGPEEAPSPAVEEPLDEAEVTPQFMNRLLRHNASRIAQVIKQEDMARYMADDAFVQQLVQIERAGKNRATVVAAVRRTQKALLR